MTCLGYKDSKDGLRPIAYRKSSEEGYIHKGYFHKFATFSDSVTIEELAIIEDCKGNVNTTFVHYIKFLDRK